MRDWELRVDDVADPVAGPGQVLTKVLACGICGSDLHMLKHGAELRRLAVELEAESPPDPMRPIPFEPDADTVMGHEFCCEVVELGPDVSNLTPGQVVVSMPAVFDTDGIHAVGYSSRYPGGYAELLVLNELLAIPVPDGVPPSLAAMTEPLAVGVHAVNKSRITERDAAIVLGPRPGRAGMRRRAQDAWHRPGRSAPTSRRGGGASPSTSGATSSSTPATSG